MFKRSSTIGTGNVLSMSLSDPLEEPILAPHSTSQKDDMDTSSPTKNTSTSVEPPAGRLSNIALFSKTLKRISYKPCFRS